MIQSITLSLPVPLAAARAYRRFLDDWNEWWPREYSWSQEKLQRIYVEAKAGGRCVEIGPGGFRCDWGTVLECVEGQSVQMLWQIGPSRDPIPDPERASKIIVTFEAESESTSTLSFEHRDFANHGAGADAYRDALASDQGWAYILQCYAARCSE